MDLEQLGSASLIGVERVFVSWTEQWDVPRYVDHYLASRKHPVDARSRDALAKLIAIYPGSRSCTKADLDYFIDTNAPSRLALFAERFLAPEGR